ncbi:MAG: TauD/TfdA dioxygenase family protein [Alphaproteobacteria bacterium]
MIRVEPTGGVLGATVTGVDLADPLSQGDRGIVLGALCRHGVLRFPSQTVDAAGLKRFSAHFGTLEINIANTHHAPGHPEVMILSNMREDGRPIGLADAGQGWHTDMSYSRDIAFANVLHAITVPRRDGRPLGSTEFANMYRAHDDLPAEIRQRLEGAVAIHDFDKFWEEMRRRPGSTRPPLTEEQRRRKPPVPQPVILVHPVTGRRVLYCNPGYAVRIEGWEAAESERMLEYLFAHQLRPEYRHVHDWTEGDVLMWDDICTLHYARPDYGPDEPRFVRRCQVMADRAFDPAFAATAVMGPG